MYIINKRVEKSPKLAHLCSKKEESKYGEKIIKMNIFIIFVSFLGFLGCSVLSVEDRAERHRQAGASHFVKGDYAGAIKEFSKAIEIYPNFARAYYNRGQSYYRSGKNDLAIADFRKSVEIDPNFIPITSKIRNSTFSIQLLSRNLSFSQSD